uniref:ATP synthase F0 subunit 8 n=1 Tax=Malawimonas californiana TaxID=221722 RepID=A0A0B5GFU6_MALCL|nr:ATP synthase F0 subunit 8 [Malawimonas californiana]AJF22882.1 ATP synthase F0 subunit 8 [Malawimonas californiana]
MPQLDKYTYSSQIFWCLVTFFTIYGVLIKEILPNIAKILKIRKRLFNTYQDTLLQFKKEKSENDLNNKYIKLISNSKESLEHVIKSYDIYTENVNNYTLSVLLKILQTIKLP